MVSRTASGLPPLGLANLAALGYGGCWGRAVGAQVALGPGLPTLRRSALERLGEFSAPEVLWLASGLQGAGVLDGAALAAARAALDHLGAGADGSLPTPWGTRLEAPPSAPGSPEVLSERDEVFAIYKPPGWSAATGFASGAHPRLADFLARAARRWPISGDAAEDRDGDTPDLTPAAPCSPRRRTGASGACVWSCAPRSEGHEAVRAPLPRPPAPRRLGHDRRSPRPAPPARAGGGRRRAVAGGSARGRAARAHGRARGGAPAGAARLRRRRGGLQPGAGAPCDGQDTPVRRQLPGGRAIWLCPGPGIQVHPASSRAYSGRDPLISPAESAV
ncbi:unnamed protein product [Prorocentrum cordatum]|uniref:Inositol-pentakisphosphate 2-kinase n=1 Tax=Prorocentrum cordatum TaxID=2364126 RepID=A0ABN9ULA7_9DINO|nr:unnamed protein product [Polarella glacialis]